MVSMHQVFINKEAVLKIVVSASSICQLGRNLKVLVSMHHVFIKKEAV